ncbi:hypothetical protein HDV05_004860 [Chytridiales sp. JEL 0842]|nr:hypothetical protein HDV05_004860 [Chytridiales sp. JEL 0842]
MSSLSEVVSGSVDEISRISVTKADFEKSLFMNSLEFNAVRSELQILEKNDFDLLRRDVARLQDEVTKLHLRMAEELRRVQSNVRLELSAEKGRVRDEQSAQEIKVKEADAKIESEIAGIRTQMESIQWDLFKTLFLHPVLDPPPEEGFDNPSSHRGGPRSSGISSPSLASDHTPSQHSALQNNGDQSSHTLPVITLSRKATATKASHDRSQSRVSYAPSASVPSLNDAESQSSPQTPTLKRKITTHTAAMKNVLDTIKTNVVTDPTAMGARGKVDWGLAAVITGCTQAAVCGCLESYMLWAIWKFGNMAWGAYSGGYQFILVYLALFIGAQWFLSLSLLDAAWNKNGMQVITVMSFNLAIFSYCLIQINQTNKLRTCSDDFIAIYDVPGYPYLTSARDPVTNTYDQLVLNSADGSLQLDLLGMCPWSLEPGTAEQLKSYYNFLAPVRPLQYIIIAVAAIGNILGAYFSYKAYLAYGWSVYQAQGASIAKKWMMMRYQFFILLLKFNIFFTGGIVAMFVAAYYYVRKAAADRSTMMSTPVPFGPNGEILTLGSGSTFEAKPATQYLLPSIIVVIVVAIFYYALGWFGIRRASYPLMYAFLCIMVGNVFAMCYALFVVSTDSDYAVTKNTMVLFCIVQLLLNLLTCIIAIFNMRDFKKGLRELLEQRRKKSQTNPETVGKLLPRTIPVLD